MTKGIAADFWLTNQLTGNWLLVVVTPSGFTTNRSAICWFHRKNPDTNWRWPTVDGETIGRYESYEWHSYILFFWHTWSTVEDSTRSNLVGKKGCNLSLLQTHNIVQRSVSKMISDSFQKLTGNPEKFRFLMFFGSMLVETQLLIDTEENQALKWCFSGEMILKYWLNSDFVNELYIYI